jgi:iron(III) transport system substrate-binding protein
MRNLRFYKTISLLIILTLLLLTSACAGGTAPSQVNSSSKPNETAIKNVNLPTKVQTLLNDAKKEKEVVFFGLTATPQDVEKFENALSEFYGFPIKMTMLAGFHPQKIGEIISASKSGVPSGIDAFVSATSVIQELNKEKLITDMNWKDFGTSESYITLNGKGLRIVDDFFANVFYNTKLVKGEDIPKKYDDLLDPKWKGKIIMFRSPTPFAVIAESLGEDFTDNLVKGITGQLVYAAKFPDVVARVSSGEFPFGLGGTPEKAIRIGAPVASAPIEPIVLPWSSVVLKDAVHPNMGKLLLYYMSTPEGQKLMDELWGYSRIDVEGTAGYRMANGKNVKITSEKFIETKFVDLEKKYAQLMGIK